MPPVFCRVLLPRRASLHCVVALLLTFVAGDLCSGEDFKQPEPLQPDVAQASEEAVGAMAGIRIPAGWQIELFAAEPDVANIVAFDVDHRGRVFVCESFRQNRGVTDNRAHDLRWRIADLAAETVQDRIDYHKELLGEAAVTYAQHDDRVRRLDDSDGDGKADRSYVVARGFNRLEEGTGAGILVRGQDIFFTNIPKLWKLIDKDDDGSADERVVMSDGYGVRVAFRGHDLHGLILGPDGRLYFSIGDRGYNVTTSEGQVLANPESGAVFRCEVDGSGLEVVATGLRNPQELAFNDVGDLFSVDNNSDSGDKARIVQILEGGDSGWRMHYQYLPDRGPFNREKIWEPFHPEQPAYIVPPIANLTDGPSGLAHYPGTGFGEQLRDTFFICDFRGGPANSGIRSFKLESDGAFYRLADNSDPVWNVLATDVAFGPDGAMYVSDWVDGWEGLGKGRIYRLIDPNHHDSEAAQEVRQLLGGDWKGRAVDDLAVDIGHADRRVRLEAQWQLAARGELETLSAIVANPNGNPMARLHAVWAVDQIARTDSARRDEGLAAIRPLLDDSDATIRAAVAKVAGDRSDLAAVEPLTAMLKDDSPRVRFFSAMSLGKLNAVDAFAEVVELLAANDNADPAIRHACIMYLAAMPNPAKLGGLSAHSSPAVRRVAVVALRRGRSAEVARFLTDPDPLVVMEAARAIHDLSIPVAIRTLAAMIDGEWKEEELIRRVLNANYRLGGAEAATKLAGFAARFSMPAEMRMEALRMLGNWSQPDSLDRVLGSYRPLDERSSGEAAEALTPHVDSLMSAEEKVRELTMEVAAQLGIKKIIPLLVQRIEDIEQRPVLRAAALRSLMMLDRPRAAQQAATVKLVPATSLLHASLEVLAIADPLGSLDKFVEATTSRDAKVRQLAWDILAKIDDPKATTTIAAGVQSYLDKDEKLSEDVHLNLLEAADARLDSTWKEKLSAHAQSAAQEDPLAPWLAALQGGDVSKGKTIFDQKTEVSCLRCHKVDRAGGEVGPNLTVIGKQRDRRYLLESICLPNAQIAKGFETAMIVNDLGEVTSGIVKSENDEYIELIQADGSLKRIFLDQIEARQKGKSSMPEDLVKHLAPRELRDLVAYLASLQVDPRAEDATE